MSIIGGHTCIGDDDGTPGRRCEACEDEKRDAKKALNAFKKIPQVLELTKEEVKILSQHLMNEYLTHEEPARSVLLKIHQFANK